MMLEISVMEVPSSGCLNEIVTTANSTFNDFNAYGRKYGRTILKSTLKYKLYFLDSWMSKRANIDL